MWGVLRARQRVGALAAVAFLLLPQRLRGSKFARPLLGMLLRLAVAKTPQGEPLTRLPSERLSAIAGTSEACLTVLLGRRSDRIAVEDLLSCADTPELVALVGLAMADPRINAIERSKLLHQTVALSATSAGAGRMAAALLAVARAAD